MLAPVLQRHVQPWLIRNLGDFPGVGHLFRPTYGIMFSLPVVLAIMVLLFIAATMRDGRYGAADAQGIRYGLGATTWEVIWNVVVPHSRTAWSAGSCWDWKALGGPWR